MGATPAGAHQRLRSAMLQQPLSSSRETDPFIGAVPVLRRAAEFEKRFMAGESARADDAVRLYREALALLEQALSSTNPPPDQRKASIIQQKTSDVRAKLTMLIEPEPEPEQEQEQEQEPGQESTKPPVDGDGADAAADADAAVAVARASDGSAISMDESGQPLDLSGVNSWSRRLSEVSTSELLQTMAVNAAAPFVLCSRLKPLLSWRDADESTCAMVFCCAALGCAVLCCCITTRALC